MQNQIAKSIVNFATLCKTGILVSVNEDLMDKAVRLSISGAKQAFEVIRDRQLELSWNEQRFFFVIDAGGKPFAWNEYLGEEVRIELNGNEVILQVPKNGMLAHIEVVGGNRLHGWIASLSDKLVPEKIAVVTNNEKFGRPDLSDRKDLKVLFGVERSTAISYSLSEMELDGSNHRLSIYYDDVEFASYHHQSIITCIIERLDSDRFQGWFCDKGQADYPMNFIVEHRSGKRTKGETFPREDVRAAIGMLNVGFSIECHGDTPCRIRLGNETGHVMAYDRNFIPVETARSVNRALLLSATVAEVASMPIRHAIAQAARKSTDCSPDMVINESSENSLCLVIPVYKGERETRECLAAVKKWLIETGEAKKIIVINDASPELIIRDLCQDFAEQNPLCVQLISNSENLGFVKSVNIGLSLVLKGSDVLLLNADAVIGQNTRQKLRTAAYSSRDVASATPLTNNGTIFSYPELNGATVMTIDEAEHIDTMAGSLFSGQTVEVPVGVGFCMYIKNVALEAVGVLGEEWGRGYCEEVDWCLRARDLGFRHVAAVDTFVWHEGSVSFGSREREEILLTNHRILERKYPEYVPQIKEFLLNDPIETYRARLFCGLIKDLDEVIFFLCHSMGGGTQKYINDVADLLAKDDRAVFMIYTTANDWLGVEQVSIVNLKNNSRLTISESTFLELIISLEQGGSCDVYVLVNSLLEVKRAWIDCFLRTKAKLSAMLHDFQWFCPRVTLVDHSDRFCGVESDRQCISCIASGIHYGFGDPFSLKKAGFTEWKKLNSSMLRRFGSVIAPSSDTARRYMEAIPGLKVQTLPHPGSGKMAKLRRLPISSAGIAKRIAVVGALNLSKGSHFLLDVCAEIDRQDSSILIGLFGDLDNIDTFTGKQCFRNFGRYKRGELASMLDEFSPHAIFFPGVWPETFSYVLSEIWHAGYPAIALDIGAVSERIRETGAGVLVDPGIEAAEFVRDLDKLVEAAQGLAGLQFLPDRQYSPEDYLRSLFGEGETGLMAELTGR